MIENSSWFVLGLAVGLNIIWLYVHKDKLKRYKKPNYLSYDMFLMLRFMKEQAADEKKYELASALLDSQKQFQRYINQRFAEETIERITK